MSTDIYTIYKTINLINGKIYIGVHKENGKFYLGSGKLLKQAIEKYGIDNFKKEILFSYETSEDAYKKEYQIVDEEFINRKDTYNIMTGGFGGGTPTIESRNKRSVSLKGNIRPDLIGKKRTIEQRKRMSLMT